MTSDSVSDFDGKLFEGFLTKNTNTETSNRTSSVQVRQSLRTRLESTTHAEDNRANQNGHSSTQLVSHGSTSSSAEESTSGENRYHSSSLSLGGESEIRFE